jgi:hypothetical protein
VDHATTNPRPRRRQTLRPGTRVFRRDDDHLQVGLDDPRVVLPDTDGVRRLLRALEQGSEPATLTPDAGLALARLVDAGIVVARADLTAAVRGNRRAAAAAVFAAHGPAAPARLAARVSCQVAVFAPEPWAGVAIDRLGTSGLAVAAPGDRSTVTLVVDLGELPRSRTDRLIRDEIAHLVVALHPDRARIGPFVTPGLTACLRCVDAHLSEVDPKRGLLLEQLEDDSGTPTPCDPALAHAAISLAVREVTTYAEGDRPASWSTTLELSADLTLPRRTWLRHPHCGCSWA